MASATPKTTEAVDKPPRDATRQLSYSGTPRGSDGLISPDEYVRELMDPQKRMELFEEMHQSDDAVYTAIEARRQEINAANWLLASDSDDARAVEILEFCEDNIYPLIDELLRLLGGGGITYGFTSIEPVFSWSDSAYVAAIARGKVKRATKKSGDRRIYLRKLAHIRQTSALGIKIAPTGELEHIVQHAFNGVQYLERIIPAEKLLLWTYDKQGDDYWGRPPARRCYKAWKFKTQIERLNLLHIDRFGVGTPVITEGEGGFTENERQKAALFAAAWRSGSENYGVLPHGATVEIISDEGKGTMSALEWVRYYNLAIAKTYLTQATELGSTETGARALGETFFEQLSGIVQADCEALASLINNQLIVPLVRWNFGEQELYPQFAPSERVKKGTGVASVLQQLIGAKALHVRPEDEAWLRDVYGLPAVEIETLQEEQDERDVQADEIARAGAVDANGRPVAQPPRPPIKIAATRRLAMAVGAPEPAPRGNTHRTVEYSEWEQRILRPDVLIRDLDVAAARLTGEVQDVLRAIDEDLELRVRSAAAKGAAQLAGAVREISVPPALRSRLRKVMLEASRRARDYGAAAVRNEIRRQVEPDGIGAQRAPLWMPTQETAGEAWYRRAYRAVLQLVQGEQENVRDLHLEAEVDRAVEDEIDRRESSARNAVLTALAQAAGAGSDALATIVATAASAALLGLSTGRTEQNVQSVVNVGFGIGRTDQAEAINTAATGGAGSGGRSGMKNEGGNWIELVTKIYSAVMDLGTCDECAKWDGGEFPIDYPENYTGVQAPNPRCAGGYNKCRCVWVYVTDRESAPSAPSTKGPISEAA